MSYAHRIPSALRACARACLVALASLFTTLSAWGAGTSPAVPFGHEIEGQGAPVAFAESLRQPGLSPLE